MRPQKSKATESWASMIEAEFLAEKSPPKDGKTFDDITAIFKKQGGRYGEKFVYAFIRKQRQCGKLKAVEHHTLKNGKSIRAIYYVPA